MKRSQIEELLRDIFPKVTDAQYEEVKKVFEKAVEKAVEHENYQCAKIIEAWTITLKNEDGSELLVAPSLLKRVAKQIRARVEE